MNRTSAPPTLLAAAAVVALEAAALVVLGVLELVHLSGDRVTLAVTTTAFFWLVAAGLAACAVALTRLSSWARGPVVAAELILVLTAFSTWGGSRQWALTMLVAAGIALVGVLHPASTAALAAEEDLTP